MENLSITLPSTPDEQCALTLSFDPSHGQLSTGTPLKDRKFLAGSAPGQWPSLKHLRLSVADATERRQFIGGSDANIILSGDAATVTDLWLEKRGEKEPADLSTASPGDAWLLDRAVQPAVVRAC